jgi:hypothetical protein
MSNAMNPLGDPFDPIDPIDRFGPAPSSYGVDLVAERALLVPHDTRALAARLHRALRRRAWLKGAAAGGGAAGAVAVLLWLAWSPDGAPIGTDRAPTVPTATQPVANAPIVVEARAETPCPLPVARESVPHAAVPPKPRAVARTVEERAPIVVSDHDVAIDEARVRPASRLRAQLSLYQRAERAVAEGDSVRARAALAELLARFPDGPLAADARALIERIDTEAAPAAASDDAVIGHAVGATDDAQEPDARVIVGEDAP